MDIGVTVGESFELLEETVDEFDFVELGIGEETDPDEIDRGRLESALDDAGLCVHLPFKQVVATAVPEINEAIVAYQRRLLQWAATVGAEKAVLHGTVRTQHDTDLRPIFADQLAAISQAGADAGVEVVVENVGHQALGLQLSVLGDLARETDTAVCFDVGHAYMEAGDDGVKRFCKRYGDLISHLHVHDVRSRGDTHMPIGAGEIDYGVLGQHLGDFEGTVAIEVFTDDLEMLTDTARRISTVLEGDRTD